MNQQEFHSEIDRLESVYGKNKYPEERRIQMYRKFRTLPLDEFRRVIDDFIVNERYAPMYNQFYEVMRERLGQLKSAEMEKIQSQFGDCTACGNEGLIIRKSDALGESGYAGRCACKRGQIMYPNLPVSKLVVNRRSSTYDPDRPF